MFFKREMQKISGFGFKSTLKQELGALEKQKVYLKPSTYAEVCDITKQYYFLKTGLLHKIAELSANDPHYTWLYLYRVAEIADEQKSFLRGIKVNIFNRIITPSMRGIVTAILFMCIIDFYKLNKLDETFSILLILYGTLLLATARETMNAIDAHKFLASLLKDTGCRTQLLMAAKKANITIDIASSHNVIWSDTPEYAYNPEEILREIKSDIPERFCCTIDKTPMKNPLFAQNSINSARFNYDAIGKWLLINQNHPVTREELYCDELIPDTKLKKEFDSYVTDELKKFINHQVMQPLLDKISEPDTSNEQAKATL